MTQTPPQPKIDMKEDLHWPDHRSTHIQIVLGIFLLGWLALCIIQGNLLMLFGFPVAFLLLPMGFGVGVRAVFPSLKSLFSEWGFGSFPLFLFIIGYPIFAALIAGIIFLRPRWMLLLCYVGLIIAVLFGIKGCTVELITGPP